MARLTGDHLKFNPADSQQGLFLIPLQADNPAQIASPAIRVGEVGGNNFQHDGFSLVLLTIAP